MEPLLRCKCKSAVSYRQKSKIIQDSLDQFSKQAIDLFDQSFQETEQVFDEYEFRIERMRHQEKLLDSAVKMMEENSQTVQRLCQASEENQVAQIAEHFSLQASKKQSHDLDFQAESNDELMLDDEKTFAIARNDSFSEDTSRSDGSETPIRRRKTQSSSRHRRKRNLLYQPILDD